MTNELEKQFFDTFGIEPHYYCADEYVFEAMLEYECTEGNREKCKTCKKVGKSYPQISDRILLELICIHNIYLETNLYSLDYESLEKEILKDLINKQESRELKKGYVSDDMKQQVQALFEEVDYAIKG